MKKLMTLLLAFVVSLNLFTISAFAAVTEEEANEVAAEKGWDRAKLQEFLDYYEMSLADFENKDELSYMIGTPITDENLNQLLSDYGLTRTDLDALLGEFGMSVEDHWSIEELDASIDFYMNHEKEMQDVEAFLETIGITETEADQLFKHFEELDQLKLEEQMEALSSRMEDLMMLDPEAELTEAQENQIIALWGDMMTIFQIQPRFSLVNGSTKTPISFRELANMEEFTDDALYVALYDLNNNLLLDMQVSEEMLSSEFAINAAEKLTGIGDLAGELTKLRHDQLPDTATTYGLNIAIGLLIVLAGVIVLVLRNKKWNQVNE